MIYPSRHRASSTAWCLDRCLDQCLDRCLDRLFLFPSLFPSPLSSAFFPSLFDWRSCTTWIDAVGKPSGDRGIYVSSRPGRVIHSLFLNRLLWLLLLKMTRRRQWWANERREGSNRSNSQGEAQVFSFPRNGSGQDGRSR